MGKRAASATKVDIAAPRLAYRIEECAQLLGVSRDTIERAISRGKLRSSNRLGVRLIDAECVRVMLQGDE